MPLLLVPLLIVVLLVLWLLLLPLSLWQRYRFGKARRLLRPWQVKLNGWTLSLSTVLFVCAMWLAQWRWPDALAQAFTGLGAGALLGIAGVLVGRLERTPKGLYYTPNAWLALLVVVVVVARLVLGFVDLWRAWRGREALAWVPAFDHASLFAVAGLLLGYYLAGAWGLRWRMRRWRTA